MTQTMSYIEDYLKDQDYVYGPSGLIGYFHQDWMLNHANWESVVDEYISDFTLESRMVTCREIDGILQVFDEDILKNTLLSRGCSYCPEDCGDTYASWMRKVEARIQESCITYDPLELIYAQQITGAERKYPVRCAIFDGYDASRRVLLFAKLFRFGMVPAKRSLIKPDNHLVYGLQRPEFIKYRVWGAYATHQLAELDALKDTTPIEWHIGIKAHAESLQYLINGSAGLAIPESRLKVIYTPYIPPTPELALP